MRAFRCVELLLLLFVNLEVNGSPTTPGTTATLSARNSASTACSDIVNNEGIDRRGATFYCFS